ncbi:MAG: cytochrome c [Gammaproteobacteria bacterium]|nr:cytochrome c [Gammaproteobacteria bacterium]
MLAYYRSKLFSLLIIFLALSNSGALNAQESIQFTLDQANAGETLYKLNCQACHGNRLSNGQFGTPLIGRAFRNIWKGKSLGELLQHTWEKMPPDDLMSLTREEVTNLVAFILSRNDMKPGEVPMVSDPEQAADTYLPWE